jgi:serine/threonine protein kinase
MVSPYMMRGNVLLHVKNNKPKVDIIALVGVFSVLSTTVSNYAHKLLDIIKGICYLHGEGFVHGDLRAVSCGLFVAIVHADLEQANVLVDNQGSASLADFGLISFIERSDQLTSGRGNPQWMAPELNDLDVEFQRTLATDIYSFACLCVEVRVVLVSGTASLINQHY